MLFQWIIRLQRKMPGSDVLFQENNLVETIQLALLILCSVLLLVAAALNAFYRKLFVLMAVLPIVAMVRELDADFDKFAGQGVWGTICVLLVVGSGALAIRWSKSLQAPACQFIAQRAFGYFAAGVIVTLAIAEMFGRQTFWKVYLGDKYLRSVPRAVEEFGEFAGYFLLLCGSIEAIFVHRTTPPELKASSQPVTI